MTLDASAKEHLRTVQLTAPQVKFVEMLASRGGEIPWDWSKCTKPAKAMIADMINKQVLIEREYVAHAAQLRGALYLRLTDGGRQIAAHIEHMALDANASQPRGAAGDNDNQKGT